MSQIAQTKIKVVEITHQLLNKGFLSATGGNISIRVPGEEIFCITPSNYDYAKMKPEDVCVLSYALDQIEGELPPSVESGLHAAVYKVRADVNTIIHTHQVYASALTLIDAPIPALFDEQVRFLGREVKIIPYAPSGTGMLQNKIAKNVKDHHNAYMMKNHGALIFGDNCERAVHNVEILEKCSLAYLLTLCTDRKSSKIPLAIREIAFAKLRKDQKKYEINNNS